MHTLTHHDPRLLSGRLGREVISFAAIGLVSTGVYAVLYLLLRGVTGPAAANAASLVVTAIGNTAANRRLTFGASDGRSLAADQAAGLLALAIALAITTGSVSLLGALAPRAGRIVELAVLVVANALATVARFLLLRSWMTAGRQAARAAASSSTQNQE